MAEKTFTVKANKWGYVRRDHPSTHYSVTNSGTYEVHCSSTQLKSDPQARIMLFGFEKYPQAAKHCVIVGFKLTLRIDNRVKVGLFPKTFDENTVTWDWVADAGNPDTAEPRRTGIRMADVSADREQANFCVTIWLW